MNFHNRIAVAIISFTLNVVAKISQYERIQYDRLGDHTVMTDSNVFPYVVAILKKQSYLCAGALLDDKWVLTAVDSLFLTRETHRIIRVRLGSINYKKGGVLLPVKKIEVHPLFEVRKPAFDVALMLLADRVWLTPTVYPIRMQTKLKEPTTTHFLVTAWTPAIPPGNQRHSVMNDIKKRRMLSVSHLHPTDPELCLEEMASLGVNHTESLMCLDADFKMDPCWRDAGAPVVLNGVLWGVISSWRPADCRTQAGGNFATLVAAPDMRSWVHAATHNHRWKETEYVLDRSARGFGNALDGDEETNEI